MLDKKEILSNMDKEKEQEENKKEELQKMALQVVELLDSVDNLIEFKELITEIYKAKERTQVL